jgi:hypothetical protein
MADGRWEREMSKNYSATPYSYLVGWSDVGKYYYGVRYGSGCHPSDLFVKYFTSSRRVKKLLETVGQPDIIQVRRVFSCKDDALNWEHKVLRRMRADARKDFLNASIGDGKFRNYGPMDHETCERMRQSRIGKKHSEETKQKIREKNKELGLTEGRKRGAEARRGRKMSEEQKEKLRQANLGKKVSFETAQKMSETRRSEEYKKRRAEMAILRKQMKETESKKDAHANVVSQ